MGTFAKIQMLKALSIGLLIDVLVAAAVSIFMPDDQRAWGFFATLLIMWFVAFLMSVRRWLRTLAIIGFSQGALERDYFRLLTGTGIPSPDPKYNVDPVDYLAWVADDSSIDASARVAAASIMVAIRKDGDHAGFVGALLIRNAAMKALLRLPR